MDAKDLKESLSLEQIEYILASIGAEPKVDNYNNNIHCLTRCHGGDSHKLIYYHKDKRFKCYTGCGKTFDIFSLLEQVLEISFTMAMNYICDKLGIVKGAYKEGNTTKEEDCGWDLINTYKRKEKPPESPKITIRDKSLLNEFYNLAHPNFLEDGISKQTMAKFNIKFDIYNNRIIIPHYNENNDLIAIRCRNLDPNQIKYAKYMPIYMNNELLSAPSTGYFYGLNFNINNILESKKVILVESEKAVMQLDTMFKGKGIAIALSGSSISTWQVEILKNLGIEEVILALDKEFVSCKTSEEKAYATKIKKIFFDKLTNSFKVSVIWDKWNLLEYKDSPMDKGKDTFLELLSKRLYIS